LLVCVHRVELRGKRDDIVPILLTEAVQTVIDLLIERQSLAALSHTEDNCIRGSDVLRKVSLQCGAANPSTLTSTNFRKHIATLMSTDHELDSLAQFMGHNIRVNRKFYRLPNDVVQMSQLAKIFIMTDKGELAMHRGKTLDKLVAEVTDDSGNIGICFVMLITLAILLWVAHQIATHTMAACV